MKMGKISYEEYKTLLRSVKIRVCSGNKEECGNFCPSRLHYASLSQEEKNKFMSFSQYDRACNREIRAKIYIESIEPEILFEYKLMYMDEKK